jgi:hypothetical protein
MANLRSPSGVAVSRVILSPEDPLLAEIPTGGYTRNGTHDHYREGTSVHLIEDRNGNCFRDFPMSPTWATVCDGVQVRHRYPDPDDRNSGVWELSVRRGVAPIYVHILSMEEYWCDDSVFGDDSSRSESFVYAIGIDVGAPPVPADSPQ